MRKLVGIINYGMGNLNSVRNAFEAIGVDARVLDASSGLADVSHVVLPGVGAFGDAMHNLHGRGWVDRLEEEIRGRGKPFLGICLGQQLLAGLGTEHGEHAGLGWFAGKVSRFAIQAPVPHVGWNDVAIQRDDGCYRDFEKPGIFYFVHSYVLEADDTSIVDGWCDYEQRFAASISRNNIWAVQFHPEKSQKDGLRVLRNFFEHCPQG